MTQMIRKKKGITTVRRTVTRIIRKDRILLVKYATWNLRENTLVPVVLVIFAGNAHINAVVWSFFVKHVHPGRVLAVGARRNML